jgi:hypothetical protein
MADGDKGTVQQFIDDVNAQFKVTATDFAEATERMTSWAREINNTFGQSRARITELQTAVVDAVPNINRLGGSIDDVGKAISEIAMASRRNVVANTEDIEKLYASSKVLGTSVSELAESFQNVGIGISQIGPELEKSVTYIQSIGGNTKQVMDSVRNNMDQMNRYQFEGGVQGLTRMAAQASMLRFEMSNTFALAEKVLSPEGAIEVASAFQRLGVASGNLADPFQLMNQSLNDPSGLQDSLAKISKQFTYFDEQTKTFKINRQGVLTLREMEKEAGLAQGSLSKMGLAAAELDKRLSDVNRAGLKFGSEEDKQYLANISKMGKSGKYEVELKDGTKKELASLNQKEFDELIDAQKEQPKTMEEIARSQMSISEIIKGDVSAIRNALLGGVVSPRAFLNAGEGARRLTTTATGAVSKEFSSTKAVRDVVNTAFGDFSQMIKDLQSGDMKKTDVAAKYLEKLGTQMQDVEGKMKASMMKALEDAYKNTTNKTSLERSVKSGYGKILDATGGKREEKSRPISSLIEGNRVQRMQLESMNNSQGQGGSSTKTQVEIAGGMKVDFNFNGLSDDLSPAQKDKIVKIFDDRMNTTDMKQYIVSVNTTGNPTKSPVSKTTYGV